MIRPYRDNAFNLHVLLAAGSFVYLIMLVALAFRTGRTLSGRLSGQAAIGNLLPPLDMLCLPLRGSARRQWRHPCH